MNDILLQKVCMRFSLLNIIIINYIDISQIMPAYKSFQWRSLEKYFIKNFAFQQKLFYTKVRHTYMIRAVMEEVDSAKSFSFSHDEDKLN